MVDEEREFLHVVGLSGSGMTLDAGYRPASPRGSEWYNLQHFIRNRGFYHRAWEKASDFTAFFTLQNNTTSQGGTSGAFKVKKILMYPDEGDGSISDASRVMVVVTTRDIWIWSWTALGFVNITPLHTDGQSACGGGTAVTGAGTAWVARGIQPGMLIRWPSISATWFVIASVGGATAITLTTNGPNTGGNRVYEIRRCMGGNASCWVTDESANRVHAQIRNGDLFVSGNAADGAKPAVIRYEGVIGNLNPVAPTSVNQPYVLATSQVETGLPTNGVVTTLLDIRGMHLADDGRVVLGMYETIPAGGKVFNRVRWNRPDDIDDWAGDGAGFTDAPSPDGRLTGIGRLGDVVTAHFTDGIALGEPTGTLEFPFRWRESQAKVGAAAPECLTRDSRGELFVGADRNLYRFVGGDAEPVTDGDTLVLMADPSNSKPPSWCVEYEALSDSVHIFKNFQNLASNPTSIGCRHVQVSLATRQIFTHSWPVPITALGSPGYRTRTLWWGHPSAMRGSSGTTSTMFMTERKLPDTYDSASVSDSPGVPTLKASGQQTVIESIAQTLWIDFDRPGILKELYELELWVYPPRDSLARFNVLVEIESRTPDLFPVGAALAAPWAGAIEYRPQSVTVGDQDMLVYRAALRPEILESVDWTAPTVQPNQGESFRVKLFTRPADGDPNQVFLGFDRLILRARALGPTSGVDSGV